MNLSSLINLLFLLSCLIILTESRVHEIATFGDGLASLPCEVDFKNCGEIYFITWSKNVSNEWQRVYSYSQGYQKALGHFSGQPNRISMDDSNMTTTGIAYLRIKNLALSDEGTYKCDVTYVHGNCPSLTYSKLFTLVKPGKPVIRINGEPLESKLLLKTDESSDISRIDVKYNPDKVKVNSNVNSGKSVNKNINESDNDSDWESTVYQVGPFTESSTLTLECSTTGGRPIPEIKWFNGTRPLRSKVNLINRETGPSVTSTIRLVVTRSDVGVKFGCSVWNNATKIPLTKWISLEIHVKPLSLKLRRPKAPVVSGEMVSLTCTVDGARPPASIVWFNRSEVVTPHPTSSTDLMSDGTYRTWSKLVFIASRYDHNGEFFCKGVNQVLKERNEVPMIEMTMLQVLYPPAVTIDPGGRIAVNESSTINLACSFDANPPNVSDIVWYKDGNLITGNDRRLPIQIDETSLTIKNVTHSHSGFYSCSLKNSFGTGNSTNHAYIDVWYPPKVSIDLRPSVIIETGKSLILQCLVSQGNPVTLTHVQWYFNGNHFETTHDPSASSLTLTNITSSHTGNYSCLGFNGARYPSPISSPKQLIVQYKPSQANLTVHYLGEMASKGITVTLVCSLMGDSGNPPAHSFVWLHQGTLLEGVDSSSYSIKSLSVSNQGNYSCAAVNKLGEGPFSHQIIKVKGAPRLIKGLPVTMGILRNQSVTVSCQIECEPLCPIEWFINNESLGVASSSSSSSSPSSSSARVTTATASSLSSDAYDSLADGYEVITEGSDESLLSSSSAFYHINFSLIKEDASSNQLASSLSYLYIKNNSWLRDNDIISCQSQTNGLGPPVKSSTIYRNEYAPERVKISISQLELLEGDKFADNLVVCSASANPSGHYHWIKGSTGQLISQGANLYFNETRINKDLRDNYTCVVTNKHGSGQAHFILNVLYRPECFIHKESLGGNRWLLSCEATSNPPVLNFTWYRYNRTVGETVSSLSSSLALSSSSAQSTSPSTVKLEFLSSDSNSFPVSSKRLASLSEDRQSSVLVLEENDLEAYSCIATNVIGTSLPCRLKQVQINAPSGWVQLLFKDENLIIVGSAFGLILFVVVFGLAIGLVFFGRRKLKSLEKSSSVQTHHHSLGRHHYDPSQANSTLHHYATQQNANHQPYQSASQLHQEQQLHPQVHHHLYNSLTRNYHNANVNNNKNHSSSLHHYSSQKYASINQSKTSSLNKLPILEERTIPDGRCSDNNCDADDISPYGHQRSPLITRSHQCITLGPVSSPLLLSEYLTDDNESETQITESPNSMNHYYESTSPLHRANYKNTVNSKSLNLLANTNNNSQNTFINVNNSHNGNNTHYSHTLIHEHSTNPHYNIPLTLSRHPPPLPPLPPERTHRHHANPAIYDYSRYHTNRIT
ncbi:hemicentin-2-like [Tetranychus urticae]|uniref:Ig-like domain-containing protein n=1 Tax=Tetranychus urticae TaxID=32264 RepID=T1K7K9_TETUR|nr:hemicentin-2-like [Tetranychus urticae]